MKRIALAAIMASLAGGVCVCADGQSCDNLTKLKLANVEITSVTLVDKGAFTPPPNPIQQMGPPPGAQGGNQGPGTPGGAVGAGGGAAGQNAIYRTLPGFCRVAASLHPSADSDIKIEVWLPVAGWNGKFEAVGNGGLAGTISYPAMAQALADGYATASTDTGHAAEGNSTATWAIGHPEKVIDFGYRSVHELAVESKAVIAAYYGTAPRYSYWNGCSEGGRQGMGEAQRYPNDFNGILAGAPVFDFTHGQMKRMWTEKVYTDDPAAYIPASKFKMIHEAALAECDAADGVKDGVINNPPSCKFKPASLLCKGADAPGCLTAPQVKELEAIYGGPHNLRTGAQIMTGQEPGVELLWVNAAGIKESKPPGLPAASAFYGYFVFEDANWNWTSFDFDKDVAIADKKLASVMNNYDPDLSAFKASGGKLIHYHGWSDPQPSPMASVNYFNLVQKKVGDTSDFYRMFLIPGMGHCGGGPGTDQFDKMGAISDWVEHGKAPDSILASHKTDGQVDRTRPLCPYPEVAKYKGSGSTDEAQNFVCAKP